MHPLGNMNMNAFYLVGRHQAGPWEQSLAHSFARLCAIAKVECPKAGPLLLPYTGTRCFADSQVTASARWRFAAALALKESLHQHAWALCRTWNMSSCYPFATVRVPLIPLSVALEAGHYWKVVLEALPFWLEYRTNRLHGIGDGSHGLVLLFLLITAHLLSWSLSK